MPDIILDNLIFDLQPHGGITSIWAPIVQGAVAAGLNLGLVQGRGHEDALKRLGAGDAAVFSERGSVLRRRFRKVAVPQGCRVFHSSYFRIAANPATKNIITVHDCIAEQFDKGPRRFLHLAQKKRALKHAERVVAVSENTRKDLLRFYPWLDPARIVVIHNGIDLGYFTPSDAPKRKVLLYVGARAVHKNFALALRLLASTPAQGLTLELCGGGALSRGEQALISKLGLEDRVRALGAVPQGALRRAYQTGFALIYPSYYEGFGIPPLEAMACGCPVLASNRSSLPEVVGTAALSFDPARLEQAQQALLALGNVAARQRLVVQGLQRAKLFSHTRMVASYVALYQELIKAAA